MANERAPVPVIPGLVFKVDAPGAHPHVVVAIAGDHAFVVNWTDRENYEHTTCVLHESDHPHISKPSAMFYARYKEMSVRRLGVELANSRLMIRLENLAPDVLARVITGARESLDLKDTIKAKFSLK